MKIKNLIFFTLVFVVAACSSTKNRTGSERQINESREIRTLEDHLLSKPGVFIQSGSIRIRGGDQSFFGDSDPLFEIDGVVFNGTYQDAIRFVNPAEIKSVRVLKKPDELAMYGTRGLNGVIKIKLKNSN